MVISFTINGRPHSVNSSVPIDTSLNNYIRNHAQLKGTKFMCLEGGCGTCIVTLKGIHPVTKEKQTWAVNSCLTPVFSCHGLDVITIEGVGNKKEGYHPTQVRLAHLNGTQCGYCSPGMVMNMYSLLESNNGSVSMEEIENSFGGNICRCTGYRPILDAFKSLASDADEKLTNLCKDIEDLTKICPKTGTACGGICHKADKKNVQISFNGKQDWHKVFNLKDLFDILNTIGNRSYMFVAGNTAHGVYRRDRDIEVFIDIVGIAELRTHSIVDKTSIVIGGNVSLTETMDILIKASSKPGFEYCKNLMKHIDLIANVPVRNAGTIAGNLSIKHDHMEFPSDMFIILEGVGAKITILENLNKPTTMSIEEYLKYDMKKKVILNINLPSLDPNVYFFRSFKIMPRAQNAHAYVNAAFLCEYQNNKVVSIRICFGGITPEFVHAKKTEEMLIGTDLYTNEMLQKSFETLSNEINPDWILPDASPEYRKNLAMALFYKFILSTCPANGQVQIKPEYKSGAEILDRELSSGIQKFDTYEDKWPLTKPVLKYEANIQTSGEAQYVNDLPTLHDELWAAFVQTTRANGKIGKIDATEALKIEGVHYFFSAKDIPGKNNFTPPGILIDKEEEIFVGEHSNILFNGQPVGVILADTMNLANYAAGKVKITYENDVKAKQVIPTLKDALELNATDRFVDSEFNSVATTYGTNATHKVIGSFQMGTQYHYTMEPQTVVCIPADNGIDAYVSIQWLDYAQIAIAQCLNIPENNLNMTVKRIGGGYGGKVTRTSQVACACALGCYLTNRPVRFIMTIESNMTAMGKRYACMNDYEVDVDDNGKIQKLKNDYTEDAGCSLNENITYQTTQFFRNCYVSDSWTTNGRVALTDSPSNTWCRAPGTTEGIAMIENIMEHIACETGKDPIDVRLANMADDSPMKKLLPDFLKQIDFDERKKNVEQFNSENRWRKRGIAISPMEYHQEYFGSFPVFIAIYHTDGSVVVTHGGIECGQGINTKVAQVTAYSLGIPLEMVSVKATNNVVSANAFPTGGSLTSEVVCYAATKACAELVARMKPVRDEMKDAKWSDITNACYEKYIDLTAKYMYNVTELKTYITWGISCAEIEIDLLTGNLQLKRVDILEDTGESMSPNVDVGQVEGAFIMGVGYWLSENIVYNRQNGELLTNRTWTYKPPGAKDIPVDFRVTFLQKSSNPFGVLRSKATGEPAICMSVVVIFALRHALNSARKDAGVKEKWFQMGAPSTPDVLFLNAGNRIEDFQL